MQIERVEVAGRLGPGVTVGCASSSSSRLVSWWPVSSKMTSPTGLSCNSWLGVSARPIGAACMLPASKSGANVSRNSVSSSWV